MTKIYVATPAYSGKVNVQYAIALSETLHLLAKNGVGIQIKISTSGSLLVAERNRLVSDFMKSDATHMLCIDADLGWDPNAVVSMLLKDVDFVAGVYPSRKDNVFMFRPTLLENGSIATNNEKGLLSMQYIAAGFMLIRRCVFEKMFDKFPETKYVPKEGTLPEGYCLFNTEVWNGEFWGEDFVFCRKAREAGVEIWVDPMITFDHDGVVGCMTSVLTQTKPEDANGHVDTSVCSKANAETASQDQASVPDGN